MTRRRSFLVLWGVLPLMAAAQGPAAQALPLRPPAPPVAEPVAAPAPALDAPGPAPAPSVIDVARTVTGEPEIPKTEPDFAKEEDVSLGWTLVRTMVLLGMVIVLVYLTLNVGLRKLLGIRPTAGLSLVTVLERVPLDQRRSLFVVEAGGEVLLIGGSDNSLALISKLDRAEVDRIRAARAAGQPVQMSPFLQKLLGRKDAPPPPAT